MSTVRIDRGLSRTVTGDRQLDRIQSERDAALLRIARMLISRAVPVFGEPSSDKTLPGGLTNGITFTAGQTKDVPHTLGREASGFWTIDATGSQPLLERETTGLAAELKKTHIRLTHNGAADTVVKLMVW